jgi:DNA-directed RNA polymerase subunit RPC12/RpoP
MARVFRCDGCQQDADSTEPDKDIKCNRLHHCSLTVANDRISMILAMKPDISGLLANDVELCGYCSVRVMQFIKRLKDD